MPNTEYNFGVLETTEAFLVSECVNRYSRGFYYLELAYLYIRENRELKNTLSKGLYPIIAKDTGTVPSCVERDIRYALRYTRYTNSAFIHHMCDTLDYYDYRRNDPEDQRTR